MQWKCKFAQWMTCSRNSPVRTERLRSEGCRRMRGRLQQREPRVRTSSSLLLRWRLFFSWGVDALWTRGWYLLLLFFQVYSFFCSLGMTGWYLLSSESVGSAPLTCLTLPVSSYPTLETLLNISTVCREINKPTNEWINESMHELIKEKKVLMANKHYINKLIIQFTY